MNINKEEEILDIDKDRIINILLKHLMYLKNECAYIKNKEGLNLFQNDVRENNIGVNKLKDIAAENNIGVNKLKDIAAENNIGENKSKGIAAENNIGENKSKGIVAENNIGVNFVNTTTNENKIGVKYLISALPTLKEDTNWRNLIYTVFEQELNNALGQYIKNQNGQNSLLTFYTDFEKAISQKNTIAKEIENAAKNLKLEDTHILPTSIDVNNNSINDLASALQGQLPRTSKMTIYETVARELLLLHNSGRATGKQLRKAGGLSAGGFAKHLSKLKQYSIVRSQPPANYMLTEKTIHILLETFGIPKK